MKKSFMTKLAAGVIAAAALFMNISCNGLIDDSVQLPAEENKVLIRPSISEVSRSVFPDINVDNIELINLKFTYGTLTGTAAVYDNYKSFSDTVVALEPGSYSFEVTAKCGGVTLSGKIAEKEYVASATEIPLAFNLDYDLAEAVKSGVGNLSYKFTYSKTKTIKDATVKIFKYDAKGNLPQYPVETKVFTTAESNKDGSQYIEYSIKNMLAGIYELQLEINGTDNKSVSYRNVMYVADGCTTTENYEIKDGYWYDKYQVGSVMYTNSSKHFSAEATSEGIMLTFKFVDGDEKDKINQIRAIEEETKVAVGLASWHNKDYNPANILPTKGSDVKILYPFTKKDSLYIFTLIRQGENYYNDSEKIIVKATADGLKIFDDDYANRYSRMALTASEDAYEFTLKYDWRKLFTKVDNTVFDYIECTGQINAGDKSWQEGKTIFKSVINGIDYNHKWVGDYNETWESGNMNLLSEKGKSEYTKLLNGATVIDPIAISNIKKLGSYWAYCGCEFKVKGNPVLYHITNIESNIAKDCKEERVTIKYNAKPWYEKAEKEISKSYKKGDTLTLQAPVMNNERAFAGWYTNKELTGTSVKEYDCTKDVTLYAKWNLQINNWNYINNNKQNEKDSYLSNVPLDEAIGYKEPIKKDKPLIVTFKGTVVSDYEGHIGANIGEHNNTWKQLADGQSKNISVKAGEKFEMVLTFIPFADLDDGFRPSSTLYATNKNNNHLFELADWSVSVDQAPVKVTLVNGVSKENTSAYYHANQVCTLPTEFTEQGLSLSGWYLKDDFTGTAVTSVTPTADMKIYAKMDVKLRDETWTNPTSGLKDGHYASGFYLSQLKKLAEKTVAADKNKVTLVGFEDKYKLKKDDKVRIHFKGTSKEAYKDEFFIQVFDTRDDGWLNSCNYQKFEDNNDVIDEKTTWEEAKIRSVKADDVVNHVIEVAITQEKFEKEDPYISFGYNYTKDNKKENYFSDWSIELTLIKAPDPAPAE